MKSKNVKLIDSESSDLAEGEEDLVSEVVVLVPGEDDKVMDLGDDKVLIDFGEDDKVMDLGDDKVLADLGDENTIFGDDILGDGDGMIISPLRLRSSSQGEITLNEDFGGVIIFGLGDVLGDEILDLGDERYVSIFSRISEINSLLVFGVNFCLARPEGNRELLGR